MQHIKRFFITLGLAVTFLSGICLGGTVPDEDKIAYLRLTNDYWQVWLTDSLGSKHQQLTYDSVDKTRVSWTHKTKSLLINSNDGQVGIYDFNSQKISKIELNSKNIHDAAISPKGKHIAFSVKVNLEKGTNDLWLYNIDSKTKRKISQKPLTQVSPTWSFDGSALIYQAGRLADGYNIWTNEIETGNESQLTICKKICADGDYNSEGVIAYANNDQGQFDIWIIPADKKSPFVLFTHPAYDAQPSWSPDSLSIAFYSNRDRTQRIWVRNLVTGATTPITPISSRSRYPVWSR